MTAVRVDLQSDTVSRPTPAMRRAMAEAEVGDEQRGEDPTVERLCRMVAELLAKEEAIFLPSGTMCNQIAVLVHCRPGDEVLADRRCHIVTSECGGAAALAGATVRPLSGSRGVFTADDVRAGVREPRRHAPVSRMVAVEQDRELRGRRRMAARLYRSRRPGGARARPRRPHGRRPPYERGGGEKRLGQGLRPAL